MSMFDQLTDFGAPESGIQPDLSQREIVARIIDNEAFNLYDPLSKSIFREDYKCRVDLAFARADEIIAFLQK